MTDDDITAKPLIAIQAYTLWNAISSSYEHPSQPLETPIMVLQGWSELPDASLDYRGSTENIDAVIAFLDYWAAGLREHRANELKERAEEVAKRKAKKPAKKPKTKKAEGQMLLDGMPEEPEPEEMDWCSLCDVTLPVSQLKELNTKTKVVTMICADCLKEMSGLNACGVGTEEALVLAEATEE